MSQSIQEEILAALWMILGQLAHFNGMKHFGIAATAWGWFCLVCAIITAIKP